MFFGRKIIYDQIWQKKEVNKDMFLTYYKQLGNYFITKQSNVIYIEKLYFLCEKKTLVE